MLQHIDASSIEIVSDDDLEAALRTQNSREDLERGGMNRRGNAKALVAFARMTGEEIYPGYSWREPRNGRREKQVNGVLCHSALEIQSAVGCPFDCTYCPYGSFAVIRVDVENICERVEQLVRSRPTQKLFKLNNRTDTLGLEPEYGLAKQLVELFAGLDQHLMLYSKGDAVDHLLDLEHRQRTIASFTLTPDPVADILEVGAPSPQARIDALGKLARAGYPTRVRISPLVPVVDWKEAYADMFDRLFDAATPEMVTLWTLSMIPYAELSTIVPHEALDGEALEAAATHESTMDTQKGAPFPPKYRSMLYGELANMIRERSPTTRVALCLETEQVWDSCSGMVSRRKGEFLCNCGPKSLIEP